MVPSVVEGEAVLEIANDDDHDGDDGDYCRWASNRNVPGAIPQPLHFLHHLCPHPRRPSISAQQPAIPQEPPPLFYFIFPFHKLTTIIIIVVVVVCPFSVCVSGVSAGDSSGAFCFLPEGFDSLGGQEAHRELRCAALPPGPKSSVQEQYLWLDSSYTDKLLLMTEL